MILNGVLYLTETETLDSHEYTSNSFFSNDFKPCLCEPA